ncbi:hypothetical protein [Streptomyces sp. NPDC005525]|uniref:hypothetical protein n=1 Tax=unclassified Streptomyces TaxID=2593676 RepID=UPI00368A34AE
MQSNIECRQLLQLSSPWSGNAERAQLTAGVEGFRDPADALVTALSRGEGADHAACRKRVAAHLKVADDGALADFLTLVRVRSLARREDVIAMQPCPRS